VPPPPPGEAPIPGGFNLFSQFSATCFYFGASLTDQMQADISTGSKKAHLLRCQFIYAKNDHFAKTGSGQT
jgi:hypothetical protein